MNKAGCTPPYLDAVSHSENLEQVLPTLLHKGKKYRSISVLNQMPPHLVKQIGFRNPLQLQLLWEEFVRRWPDIADSIIYNLGEQASWGSKSNECTESD